MKKYLVDVYLAKNLGDDMFLDHLARHFPQHQFTPYYPGKDYDTFFGQYQNIIPFKYTVLDKLFRKLKFKDKLTDYSSFAKEFDGIIFLGGGIFREESYWKEVHHYRKSVSDAFKQNDKNVFWLGCNFGPFTTEKFKENYSEVFAHANDVCFRDQYSYNLFKDLNSVRYAPDLLWSFPVPKTTKKSNKLGVSVIDPAHKKGLEHHREEYITVHQEFVAKYLALGYEITLYSFCEAEGDLAVANEVAKPFGDKILIENYTGMMEEYIASLVECSALVSGRFHANVLGFLLDIKVLPLIYSIKTENLLQDINFSNKIVHFDNLSQLLDADFNDYQYPEVLHLSKEAIGHFKELENCEK